MSNITTSANANHIADDGQMHSLAHQKYGPYTCPRCDKVFLKSQSFAAHVHSHYKDETEEERMRRLLRKTKKRKLSSQMVNNQSTWVPLPFKAEAAILGNANRRPTHRHAPMAIKEEKVEQDLYQVQRTTLSTLGPPPGFEGHPRAKTAEITLNDNNNHLGPPPGFEGHPRYDDAKTDHGQRVTQSVVDYIKNILGPPPGFEGHPRYGDAKTDQSTLHHINDNLSHPPGFEGRPHCSDAKIKSEPFA